VTKTELKKHARRLVLDYGNTADAFEESIREFRLNDIDDAGWRALMEQYDIELSRVEKFLGITNRCACPLCEKSA